MGHDDIPWEDSEEVALLGKFEASAIKWRARHRTRDLWRTNMSGASYAVCSTSTVSTTWALQSQRLLNSLRKPLEARITCIVSSLDKSGTSAH